MAEYVAPRIAAGRKPLWWSDAAGGDLPCHDAEPQILLADEPVASLDPKNTTRIMNTLQKISENDIAVMLIYTQSI